MEPVEGGVGGNNGERQGWDGKVNEGRESLGELVLLNRERMQVI